MRSAPFTSIEDDSDLMYRQYIDAGLRVIPLNKIIKTNSELVCGCANQECKAVGKHPVAIGWGNTPFWDDEQIEFMRTFKGELYPAFGALIDNGVLVVDIDERNGGAESLERLESKLGLKLSAIAGFSVQSGSGGKSAHYYFRQSGEAKRLRQSLNDYPGIDFKSSGFVVGCGSPHASGNDYEKLKGWPEDIAEPPLKLIEMLAQSERLNVVVDGVTRDIDVSDLAAVVSFIDPSKLKYEEWIYSGMAIHYETGGSDGGLKIWDDMSQKDYERYKEGECDKRWHGFGKTADPIKYGTLSAIASRFGFVEPVTFDASAFEAVEKGKETETAEKLGIVLAAEGVKPWDMPGFAGQLYKWIDGQCRYPRASIAAGATLYALSCIGGMRHEDDRDGMPLNMMVFNVAGTGTGKDAINQAVTDLFSRIGIVSAMHGKIKSEQEIYRNLLRNQGAFYNIDEMGIFLEKLSQAAKGGGASYLTAVIGAIMEIYTKANGILAVTGDLKEEIKEALLAGLAKINASIDKGRTTEEKAAPAIEMLKQELKDADEGIVNPFLALLGTTTPETFDNSMTEENAKNGFIARALILREQENNPRWKPGFKPASMDMMTLSRLNILYWGGNTHGCSERVCFIGDKKKKITTNSEADHALNEVYEYFWLQGESHKNRTGLEGITRRGWEMCSKISLILAMADGGVRTLDHVAYGFSLAKSDVALKIEYAYSANEEAQDSVAVRLLSRLSFDEALTRGQANRILRSNTKGTQELIDALVRTGHLRKYADKDASGKDVEMIMRLK